MRNEATRVGFCRGVARVVGAVVLCASLVGCQSFVAVPLRVKVESPLDLGQYPTWAVLPVVDRDGRLSAEQLYTLSNMVRQRLERVEGISLLSHSETLEALAGVEVTPEALDDGPKVAEWGRALGVSCVVTGRIRYYVFNRIQTRPVEWWDSRQRTYVSEVETYLVRSHHISMDLRVRDAETGEVLAGDEYRGEWDQPESVVGVVMRELSGSGSTALQLAEGPIRDFVRSIASSYEFEERYLLR